MINRQHTAFVKYYDKTLKEPQGQEEAGHKHTGHGGATGYETDWPPWAGFCEDVRFDMENDVEYISEAEYSDTQSAWEEGKTVSAAPSVADYDGWEEEGTGWDGEDYPPDAWKDDDWETSDWGSTPYGDK